MNKSKLKKILVTLSLVVVAGGYIGFAEKQLQLKTFKGIEIHLTPVNGIYFVEKKEIQDILGAAFPELKSGLPFNEIPLQNIEKRLLGHPFIRSVEAFVTEEGMVQLQMEQHEPIARIARPDGPDAYITKEGKIIGTSPTYTSRVLVLHGLYIGILMDMGRLDAMPELLPLIEFISQNKFWNSQITELEIHSKNDIRLYQQVGKQVIEFGDARNFESKFKRIEVLYKEILPRKGWNAYQRISVKFANQIVCE